MQYAGDDDIYDEDEVRQLLLSGSEEDTEIITEIGYDADNEETHLDDAEKGIIQIAGFVSRVQNVLLRNTSDRN